MSLITSPEFFVNMKHVPTKDSAEYDAFVKAELDKLQYGVTINGVYIPNWLYWHVNYWKIYRPAVDERNGEVVDIFATPELRDNEWMIAEHLERAKQEKKGLMIIGSRRIAKTTFVASWLALGATIYEGSQNVIVGNNKNDISNITAQMDVGLSNVEPFLRYGRIFDDWKKEVSLGFKAKRGGQRHEWSKILIRNTEDGIATQALAGLTPKTLVYDEVGKAPTKEVFLAGMKAFASPFGWRCVPILTGTGGDMKKGKDAEEMFKNPERFNLIAVEYPEHKEKRGVFLSGLYSIDVPKNEIPLSEYLKVDKGSELDEISIHVADEKLGMEIITTERENFLKANDQIEYLQAVMFAPLNVEECFLSNADENPFPVDAAKKHKEFVIRTQERQFIRLFRDVDGKVNFTTDTKYRPVTDFPVTRDTNKNAPVVIYEPPMSNPPLGLYIAGADPYNVNTSLSSPSLGTVYIYKRSYDPIAGTFQNRVVASYAARPELMKEWHETVELLLELYNATCLIEYSGTNFTQYMDGKNKAHYLADGYNLAREINPKTSMQGNIKGLPPTTKVQDHYFNLIIEYCKEEIIIGVNPETKEPIKVLGLTRIPDDMLLEELISYRKGGNFDRIVAFGHALTYDEHLRKIMPNIRFKPEEDPNPKPESKIRSPFILNSPGSFGKTSGPFILK